MDYESALAYLDEHASYDKTGRVDSPSVEPISRLASAMGDPHLAQPVIHVTGTNGKGSTVQIISRLLMAQGLTVGTYTSPHLERVNERIKRNGESISDEEFGEVIAGIADMEAITGVRPTYFEAVTAAAFRWFADVAVDVAVIEVGMLGRWDATNIVDAQVAVVTNIALDHTEFAGPTTVDIAREKAGIIKPGSAAIIGETEPDLVQIFRDEGGATTMVRGDDFETVDNSLAIGGRALDLRTPTTIYSDVFLPLHGAHQGDNAAVALTAVETFFAAPLAEDVVHEGFANVEMPGRFEVLGVQPLTIIDGAHNPPGADVCASVFFDDFQPEGRRILIVGTLRDPGEMLAALRADEFDVVHACTAPSPRGVPGADIAKAARSLGCDEVYVHDDVEAACKAAMKYADSDDAILACGSIYVAGAAREPLRRFAN
ncbi:dihydrofolate synthase/folylpolyglutamate synthase [Ilumatobacter fluminis]|uniref:tetrahydrofolate synthase n=1 Tax=Ilumatobacter fluminis TaxID=467091 RepID=A0A4R7HXP8_9ACTN|nr:folylpolyglutamate synthase/dihydrofolate synthase family protein [Ilumatobacter fluminis]TDT15982.1 dihydrofolate synthase/folylpolyglutamate synthase [Ilumatobacter fluminis]